MNWSPALSELLASVKLESGTHSVRFDPVPLPAVTIRAFQGTVTRLIPSLILAPRLILCDLVKESCDDISRGRSVDPVDLALKGCRSEPILLVLSSPTQPRQPLWLLRYKTAMTEE
jgi:hypothetical protein